jgi:hypothetical protein
MSVYKIMPRAPHPRHPIRQRWWLLPEVLSDVVSRTAAVKAPRCEGEGTEEDEQHRHHSRATGVSAEVQNMPNKTHFTLLAHLLTKSLQRDRKERGFAHCGGGGMRSCWLMCCENHAPT